MYSFKIDSPFFIIGNPRSGTSLLRAMLNKNPSIVVPLECHFFLWLEAKYKNWDLANIDIFLEDLYASRKFETWGIEKNALKEFLLVEKISTYEQAVANIYLFSAVKDGKKPILWGDKNKLWKDKLCTILEYFPNAKFVHIVRDGRDVACSYKQLGQVKSESIYFPNLPTEIDAIAEKWTTNVNFISNFIQNISPSKSLTIRYEDLILNTKKTLLLVCDFLSVEYSDMSESYFKDKDIEIEPKDFLFWKSKLLTPPDVKNIRKFETILTREEVDSFNNKALLLLKKFNYE